MAMRTLDGLTFLVRAAPFLITLSIMGIILVGASYGLEALAVSLLIALPLVLILLRGYSKVREVK
jgi:hypothetical protein